MYNEIEVVTQHTADTKYRMALYALIDWGMSDIVFSQTCTGDTKVVLKRQTAFEMLDNRGLEWDEINGVWVLSHKPRTTDGYVGAKSMDECMSDAVEHHKWKRASKRAVKYQSALFLIQGHKDMPSPLTAPKGGWGPREVWLKPKAAYRLLRKHNYVWEKRNRRWELIPEEEMPF